MKTIILLLTIIFTIFLFSCDHSARNNPDKIKYFKDKRTNLCFAEITSISNGINKVSSITCVLCDSVKLYLNAE